MNDRSIVVDASSSQIVTRQQRKRAVDAVMFQVLDNPSLREEIIKHVIFGKVKVDRKAACTLRLLGKSWNHSVVRILWQAHEHLFQVRSDPIQAVDPFVSTFAASVKILGSVPPLAILNFGGLCHPENFESFSNCLTRCGDGLIQLGLTATEDGRRFKKGRRRMMEAALQNWSLPRLHKLDITLDFKLSHGHGEVVVKDDEKLSTFLLKSVLRTATSLSELMLNVRGLCSVPPKRPQFTVFDSVILPPSITIITARITGSTQPMEMLARSPLPNLTSLTMCVVYPILLFWDGLIIRILENCRKSLKIFRLGGLAFYGKPDIATRFPVMEQLAELSMNGVNAEPKLGRDSLAKYFPKLTTLHFLRQSIDLFQKWAGSSPVPGVTYLRLSLCQNLKASLNLGTMQRVNFVFPNLRKLKMTMSSEDSSGLGYIFREMQQLTDLDINVECYVETSTSSDIWDSLFTGVPEDVIARSRVDPDFWTKNDLEEQDLASIKNLSELKRCSLTFDRGNGGIFYLRRDEQIPESPYPSISDFVFNCALLRMPKLTELHLARRSSHNVSQEMIAKWRNDGRSLTFH